MADLPRSPHRGALRSRTYIGIAAAMALQWMPTLLGCCKIRTSRPKTVNEMLHAARLSLAATPDMQLPLNHVAHVDADPRAAPIQLGGGQEGEDGPSLESNQRPWLEEYPLPRVEVDSAPKTINLRRNKWQTFSVGADGIRKWTPVNEGLGALLIREIGRGRGVGRTGRGSGRGSNIQKSSIVEEDEPPVEENKESPRTQEIDEDADNSPPIINDVDSDEEDPPVESKANPVSSSPIILDLDGSSRNHGQSNSQIVSSVKRGDDSRSEDTALTHHRLRVSWDNIESGKVRGPTDRRGLGFSGPPLPLVPRRTVSMHAVCEAPVPRPWMAHAKCTDDSTNALISVPWELIHPISMMRVGTKNK
eukprot:scaffold5797_cov115-Isochrysis_galbana.AAC.10